MTEDRLISIIVPVYNTEKYVRQAIDSILAQTYENIEVILVDDGSTDESGKICDEYMKKDKRVVTKHQLNQGQATARNEAFKISKGEYIIYADSDDLMHKDQVKCMIKVMEETMADIIQVENSKFYRYEKIKNMPNESIEKINYSIYTASEALELLCYQRKFNFSPVCKLIKRELMNDLEFPTNTGYEDAAIMYKLYGKAEKLVYSPTVLYWYRQHAMSTMHTKFSDKKVDRIRIMTELKQYIIENFPENSSAVQTRYCLAQLQLLMELPFSADYKSIKKMAYSNLKGSRKEMLMDRKAPKKIKIMVLASYFGPNVLMILGRLYMRVTKR